MIECELQFDKHLQHHFHRLACKAFLKQVALSPQLAFPFQHLKIENKMYQLLLARLNSAFETPIQWPRLLLQRLKYQGWGQRSFQ